MSGLSAPETRFQEWIRLNDQDLADYARDEIDSAEALSGGLRRVSPSQLRALHNTAKMCETPQELKTFVRHQEERRRASGKETEADFWEALLTALGTVQREYSDEAIEVCDVPETDSESVRHRRFDHRKAQLKVARRFVEHFTTHCQYLSKKP